MDILTFNNRISVDLFANGKKIWINSPETLIAVKLAPGYRSEQDQKDVKGILLRSSEQLDWKLLEEFCTKLGGLKLLKELKNLLIENKQK